MKALEQKIVSWLKKKVKESKTQGIVFGLSGGIDSAVVAGLVKKVVGNNHLALLLPCHSSPDSEFDAKAVVKVFKLKSKTVDLTGVFDSFKTILPKSNPLADANIKPRLRMMTLYYYANKLNYLVSGTGNRSELLIGYYTKYGDGGVDILPIADLYKAQVRELAERLGVPQSVIDKPPSADLWQGQTDEQEMGVKYSELDQILEAMDSGKNIKICKRKIAKVKKMNRASEHKRGMPEICIIK